MQLNVKIEKISFGTSIQDIVVPDILKRKIPSGLEYFDAALGGKGFTPSAVTLFTGMAGAGKTTIMLALADAIQGNGGTCIFNTAEESLYQIKLTSDRLRLRNRFLVGSEDNVVKLLKGCTEVRSEYPERPFFLIVDSLQCMNDDYFKSGRITHATSERSLQILTDYAKEYACNIIVIGQVTKEGRMAGTNKLKHMIDAHIHLSIEEKDPEAIGVRLLETQKNRFGGAGHIIYLDMSERGLVEIGRKTAS
tara:strand:+ start:5708 stop:6457 length:750 start_codon:yes stop_codon:yes gene_type:complete